MGMPTVTVLMSTFNGEKYIREQIDSILTQKDVDVRLLIRDDGSTDSTQSICSEYCHKYNSILFYQGENIGVGKSFMDLLINAPEADYYAFADQDDFWIEDKLIRAIGMIEDTKEKSTFGQKNNEQKNSNIGIDVPILYASNQMIVNEKLEKMELRYSTTPRHDLLQEIAFNSLSGCTMVMNKEMKKIIVAKENYPDDYILNTRIHDTWTMIVAAIFGIIVYDEESRILYRQHENNVVGAKKMTFYDLIRDKYVRFTKKKYKGNRSKLAKMLVDRFSQYLTSEQVYELGIIYGCKNIKGAISLLRNKNVRGVFRESDFVLFVKCLLGWI